MVYLNEREKYERLARESSLNIAKDDYKDFIGSESIIVYF